MKILLATDGSNNSDWAARFLRRLDLSAHDRLAILHVISEMPMKEGDEPYFTWLRRTRQEIAPKIIESAAEILSPTGVKITSHIRDGYADTRIQELADEMQADLIVMGARGLKGVKAILLGSMTRSVAINASRPVLVVKPPQEAWTDPLRTLLATDGSDAARETARLLTILPLPEQTEVTVLRVIESGLAIPEKFGMQVDANIKKFTEEIRARMLKDSDRYLTQMCDYLCDRFDSVDRRIKDGDPLTEILATAGELRVDLIAVGSKGMRGMKGMLGSVSRYILSRADCSVLIGKKPEGI